MCLLNLLFVSSPLKRPDVLKKWVYACGLSLETDDVSRIFLCSCHFLATDFIYTSFINRRLKQKAIPSLGTYKILENDDKENVSLLNTTVIETKAQPSVDDLTNVMDHSLVQVESGRQNAAVNPNESEELHFTPKRRRYAEPRYISEIQTPDFATPTQAERVIRLVKSTTAKQTKKIRQLQNNNHRLKNKIKSLNNLVDHLKNKQLISADSMTKHFTHDQFENNRQDNKRLLKWNAVPTLFNHSVDTKISRRKVKKTGRSEKTDLIKRDVNNHIVIRKSSRIKKPIVDLNLDLSVENHFLFDDMVENETKELHNIKGNKRKAPLNKRMVCVNIENICRLCGKLSDHLLPIFGDFAKEKHIPTILNRYLPIKISDTDIGRPKNICDLCIKKLTDWDELLNKCQEVEKAFNKLLVKPDFTISNSKNISSETEDNINSYVDKENKDSLFSAENEKKNIMDYYVHDHNYCPTEPLPKLLSVNPTGINDVTFNNKEFFTDNIFNKNGDVSEIDGKSSDSDNDDNDEKNKSEGIVVDHRSTLLLNHKKSLGNHKYKIGLTLVKNKEDITKNSELQFNSLKSLLISKVNQLFLSICNDKTIEKSLNNNNNDIKSLDYTIYDTFQNNQQIDRLCDEVDAYIINHSNNDTSDKINYELQKEFPNKPPPVAQSKMKQTSKVLLNFGKKPRGNVTSARNKDDGPFLCSFCGHVAKKRRSFLQHRRIHHVEKKCMYCDKAFASFIEYRRHIRLFHIDKINNYCCDICGAKFIRKERLERHKLIIHNIGEYLYCNLCNKRCASKQQLHCHKSDVHHREKNLCQYCGQNFASYNAFWSHLQQKHYNKSSYCCDICEKKFSNSNSLTVHLARHATVEKAGGNEMVNTALNNKMISCLICYVKIAGTDLLQQHMKYHSDDEVVKILSGNNTGNFKCNLCEKYLDKEKDLALHRFYFHEEPPFVCLMEYCNCTFWSKSTLVVHQITEHKKYKYNCKICSESFCSIIEKQRHMKRFHPETVNFKSFVCATCNKRFCSKATLKVHMVVHSDVKKFNCHLCDKSFKLKLTLSRHLLLHKKNNEKRETQAEKHLVGDTLMDVENFIICNNEPVLEEEVCTQMLDICSVFKCSDCSMLFTHRNVFEDHIANFHNVKEEFVNNELNGDIKLTIDNGSEFI